MTKRIDDAHCCDLLCPVEHIMRRDPKVIDAESTLRETAQAMVDGNTGAALVLGDKGPTSIVTERDVVRALADRADPDTVWAADVASTHLVALGPTATVSDTVRQMATEGIRHVPVMADGNVVGLVGAENILDLVAGRLFDSWAQEAAGPSSPATGHARDRSA